MSENTHARPVRIAILTLGAVLVAVALSGCSTDGGQSTGPTFDVRISDPGDTGPLALGQVMFGQAAFTPSVDGAVSGALAPAELIEVETGAWIGNAVDAGAGDTVAITLPGEDDIPAGTYAHVEQAFLNATEAPDCQVNASTDAMVSVTVFEFLSVPGLVAYTVDGLTGATLSDTPLDLTEPIPNGTRLYTWIHSDGAVDVTFSGGDCSNLAADLRLEAGWNFAAWVYDDATSTATLVDVEQPESMVATIEDIP